MWGTERGYFPKFLINDFNSYSEDIIICYMYYFFLYVLRGLIHIFS